MTGCGIDRRGPKDSENAHNSFLNKSTEKGFWRFAVDMIWYQYWSGLCHCDLREKNRDGWNSLVMNWIWPNKNNKQCWMQFFLSNYWKANDIIKTCISALSCSNFIQIEILTSCSKEDVHHNMKNDASYSSSFKSGEGKRAIVLHKDAYKRRHKAYRFAL